MERTLRAIARRRPRLLALEDLTPALAPHRDTIAATFEDRFPALEAACDAWLADPPGSRAGTYTGAITRWLGGRSVKALLCKQEGTPESLVLEDLPEPTPGPGEVRVAVRHVGINFPDCLMIEGKYQVKPPFPFAPGGEFSGVVGAVGEGVTSVAVGDRVAGGSGHGALAEALVVSAASLRKVAEGMPLAVAAAWNTTYGTSYHALKQRGQLKPGETLLVLGAAGGVGLAAVELGKAMGARVLAAASTEAKRQAALEAGADEVIDYSDGDLKEKVKALTDGRGADVIYDPVGGPFFDQCLRSIAWNGRILVVGSSAETSPRRPST